MKAVHKALRKKLANLDIDRLQEVLDYDPETGDLTWLVRLSPRCRIGEVAGKVATDGRRQIVIDKISFPASHLAWFHFYGVPAEQEIGFRNANKLDLRIKNLRQGPLKLHSHARKKSSNNTTGFKGVAKYYEPHTKAKYRSAIRHEGKRIFLGLFDTPEEAFEAYSAKAKELFGEFARLD